MVGTKLEYDKNGHLKGTSSSAREVGTTVTLSALFHNLPVRLKDFQKNKTREYQRLIRKLQVQPAPPVGPRAPRTGAARGSIGTLRRCAMRYRHMRSSTRTCDSRA
jgi:hypothetical protein